MFTAGAAKTGFTELGSPRELARTEELVLWQARFRRMVLCYLEGKTYQEAAAQLRCPIGTIKGRLSRARQTLRVRLSPRGLDSYPRPLGATS